jgi:hypothetical protein
VINAPPPPLVAAPLQNTTPIQQNITQTPTPNQTPTQTPTPNQPPAPNQTPTPNPNANGSSGGRQVGDDLLNAGGDTDEIANVVGGVASKVMGGMNAALDGIPVLGEVVGIGSLIGGLIHGLDKKKENAAVGRADTSVGGTVGGGLDTSVFKSATLGASGGGYTV